MLVLRGAGIAVEFSVTVSTEEVEGGKPAPDVYQAAVARLHVPAHRTVAIEDATSGIRSAATAGLLVIALPGPAFPPADDALALAVARVDRLDDLTVQLVESVLAER